MLDNGRQDTNITLGLGELRAATGADTVLACLGLGSCVAMCAYDPVSKVGGMAHMVLPRRGESTGQAVSAKFVDCGVPMLIEQMEQLGAKKSRLVVKLVGGAQMIANQNHNGVFHIGERNAETAKAVLADLGVPIRAVDTGGNRGRTVRLHLESGRLMVSSVGGPSHEL